MHESAGDDEHVSDDGGFARVAAVSEVPPGTAIMVPVGDFDIAIFNVGGQYFAVDDVCPHAGGSLQEGYVSDGTVTCPLHGWCFNLQDGSMTNGRKKISTFDLVVEGNDISVSRRPRP
jgi:nitrite reductase (NADH) small subunit